MGKVETSRHSLEKALLLLLLLHLLLLTNMRWKKREKEEEEEDFLSRGTKKSGRNDASL